MNELEKRIADLKDLIEVEKATPNPSPLYISDLEASIEKCERSLAITKLAVQNMGESGIAFQMINVNEAGNDLDVINLNRSDVHDNEPI